MRGHGSGRFHLRHHGRRPHQRSGRSRLDLRARWQRHARWRRGQRQPLRRERSRHARRRNRQ
nr:hypothetical protein [Verminephrobacter aporrectodeae]